MYLYSTFSIYVQMRLTEKLWTEQVSFEQCFEHIDRLLITERYYEETYPTFAAACARILWHMYITSLSYNYAFMAGYYIV